MSQKIFNCYGEKILISSENSVKSWFYGESIRLPCDFFKDTKFQPQPEFVQKLKATIKDVKPTPFSLQAEILYFQRPSKLFTCVRPHDSVLQSLQPPYHGPCQVIKRSERVFTVLVKNKNVSISIDRLKPCFSDNSSESVIAPHIGKSQADKPAETVGKKIRFAPLPIAPSTRLTRRRREICYQ
ncbi:hypothetical protein AVEN_199663-1 [Araneus ventricosus]|uniref:Uncharacterized protein n=1 Tax=Araneus ventricosus TaxID=182803 RepID=A0A4Y2DF72_ARAVE|nr:hypothetical protein AVEN_199663-1 [Araneus ventricosus]